MLDNATVLELIRQAKQPATRQESLGKLIEDYQPYIDALAANRQADFEDRQQAGIIGLIDAVDRFDETRSENFKALLTCCILNAMKEYSCGTSRISNTGYRVYIQMTKVREALTGMLGRSPTDEEIADGLGSTLETVQKLIASEKKMSIHDLYSRVWSREHSHEIVDNYREADPLQSAIANEDAETRHKLYKKILKKVPKPLKPIFYEFLVKNRTYADIARKRGVTRQAIQLAVSKVLTQLREHFHWCEQEYLDSV